MSYDIPDKVKYRERIVFGLDVKQLCYFCVFVMLAFFSYSLPLEGEAKFVLPSILAILGAGFVFLNFEEHALDIWHYYTGVRKAAPSDAKAQQLVGIKSIENGQIVLMDGSLRAVLQVEPINFSLLDEGQKTAFVSNYREFLNHLTDPIQILVRTEKSEAEEVFMEAQGNLEGADTETAAMFRDFYTFEREFLEAQKVRGRRHYLIAAQPPQSILGKLVEAGEGRRQLDQKTKIIQEKLSACALRSERLGTGELLRLFSTYAVPEHEGEGQKKDERKKPFSPVPMPVMEAAKAKIGHAAERISAIGFPAIEMEPLSASVKNGLVLLFSPSLQPRRRKSMKKKPAKTKKHARGPLFPQMGILKGKIAALLENLANSWKGPLSSVPRVAWIRIRKNAAPDTFPEEITPDFDISQSYAKVNGTFHRIIKAIGYPRNVEDGWLEQFMATSEPYDVSLHIHPASIGRTLAGIHNQIIRQTSDLLSSQNEGTPNPSLEIKKKDTMKVYGLLYKGKEKMFNVSLYVDCQADSLEELEMTSERCKANMNALLIVPKQAHFRMADGIKSVLPVAVDALQAQREFLTRSLCATFPFLYPVGSKREGIFFAHERNTLNPLFIDFDSMSNKHFFVLGISGSGKSYAAKFLLMQHMLAREPKIYILDPNAEYSNLVRKLGGEEIAISKDSDRIINLFDLAGEDFGSKMLTLISVFDIITGGLTESQKGVLNEALVRVYRKMGIEAANPASWGRKAPTFSDLRGILEDMRNRMKRRLQSPEEKSVDVLLNRVRMYSRGGFFGFLDRGTNVDLRGGMLDFDLSGLPVQVKQLVMFSVLELISREIRKDKLPKLVLIDEAWSLLRSKEAENYIMEFIKTSRKFNASIGFITQEIEDLLRSEGGRSILNTTSTKMLLRQNSSNLELISKTLALNAKERDYLLRAEKGQGLMISEQGRYEFIVKAPPMIHKLITTDPNEEAAVVPLKKERKEEAAVDCARGFYLESELSDHEKDTLSTLGYVYHQSHVFDRNGCYNCMVRTQANESPEHALLCWAIAEEIKKHGAEPEVLATVGADVSVKVGKKLVFFEVETGSVLESHGREYMEKKMDERRKACDRLIVVVTDRKKRGTYEKIARATTITRTEVPETVKGLFG